MAESRNEYEYEGIVMSNYFPAWGLNRIKETLLDDSDILIATYPKCGTTWMQEIVYQVQTEGDFEGSDEKPLFSRFNFLEDNAELPENPNIKSGLKRFEAEKPPRLTKTHLYSHFYKKTLENKKTKIIVVFRNPKDMLVSYYHFYKMLNYYFHPSGSWEEFFKLFKNNKLNLGSYFDMQLSWWAYKDDPRVEFFKYEDMLNDPEQAVRQVAAFLEKDLSDELIQKIVERTSFKSMKGNPMLNYSTCPGLDFQVSPFMRKGQVGDWKNYFTEEQSQYVDKMIEQKFKPAGIVLEDS